jgi:hypothetical protein
LGWGRAQAVGIAIGAKPQVALCFNSGSAENRLKTGLETNLAGRQTGALIVADCLDVGETAGSGKTRKLLGPIDFDSGRVWAARGMWLAVFGAQGGSGS